MAGACLELHVRCFVCLATLLGRRGATDPWRRVNTSQSIRERWVLRTGGRGCVSRALCTGRRSRHAQRTDE
ncbi:hypothetical protein C7974DRAFT_399348 [Boeremia exigua]|uniref:uncharacterized protein n=1 Tax=Boeremia exigua TaxID=749465 RepID=UPI001E8E5053|nr:uncharacterized protein C7974DRAFT_399348 [Boeremia exigua]KAH6620279.1 hypothetical protein C7974DRAFT_399348 [Boeremia exigua]